MELDYLDSSDRAKFSEMRARQAADFQKLLDEQNWNGLLERLIKARQETVEWWEKLTPDDWDEFLSWQEYEWESLYGLARDNVNPNEKNIWGPLIKEIGEADGKMRRTISIAQVGRAVAWRNERERGELSTLQLAMMKQDEEAVEAWTYDCTSPSPTAPTAQLPLAQTAGVSVCQEDAEQRKPATPPPKKTKRKYPLTAKQQAELFRNQGYEISVETIKSWREAFNQGNTKKYPKVYNPNLNEEEFIAFVKYYIEKHPPTRRKRGNGGRGKEVLMGETAQDIAARKGC